jgi:hypothetical protein
MAIRARTRTKRAATAVALVPGGVIAVDYVAGRGKARFARGPILAIALFAMLFVGARAFGYVLFPGWVLVIYVIMAIRPPRGVLITTQGLVLLDLSISNEHPKKVLAYLPLDCVPPPDWPLSGSRLALGPEIVGFRASERRRLITSTATARAQRMATIY